MASELTAEQLRELGSRVMRRLAGVLHIANATEDDRFDETVRDGLREYVVGLRTDFDRLRAELATERLALASRTRNLLDAEAKLKARDESAVALRGSAMSGWRSAHALAVAFGAGSSERAAEAALLALEPERGGE